MGTGENANLCRASLQRTWEFNDGIRQIYLARVRRVERRFSAAPARSFFVRARFSGRHLASAEADSTLRGPAGTRARRDCVASGVAAAAARSVPHSDPGLAPRANFIAAVARLVLAEFDLSSHRENLFPVVTQCLRARSTTAGQARYAPTSFSSTDLLRMVSVDPLSTATWRLRKSARTRVTVSREVPMICAISSWVSANFTLGSG